MKKIKRYISNLIFFILMLLSSFILVPISVIMFTLYILYFPFEFIMYKKNKERYKKVFDYCVFYSYLYKKSIRLIKNEIKDKDFIFDNEYKAFVVQNKEIYVIRKGNKKESNKYYNFITLKNNIMNKYNIVIEGDVIER